MNRIKIDNRTIGIGERTYIIAELSGNHVGKIDIAMKSIKAMKESGADAVKLQTYTADTITLNSNKPDFQITQGTIWDGRTLYNLYQEAFTPWDWQPKLKKYAESLGLTFFSSPFDFTAVDFLEKMNVPAYKVASFEITDIPLIRYIASKGKPIIFSTGVALLDDIKLALRTIRETGNEQIAILKCTSAYPTPLSDVNLRSIADMQKKFQVVVGLSDHTLGTIVSVGAVALGASIIEKHFILDRNLGGPDAAFSLEPAEFKKMVSDVRNIEQAMGTITYELGSKAVREREHTRSLYIAEDMKRGEFFTKKNLRSVRPGYGLHTKHWFELLGQKVTRDVKMGERMDWSLVEGGKSKNKKGKIQ